MNARRKKFKLGLVASASPRGSICGTLGFHERRVWTDQMRYLRSHISAILSITADRPRRNARESQAHYMSTFARQMRRARVRIFRDARSSSPLQNVHSPLLNSFTTHAGGILILVTFFTKTSESKRFVLLGPLTSKLQ